MAATRFYWDERCFWHSGGNYAFTAPVGDLVQPLAAGGLPENPETKRRLVNLLRVTGLIEELDARSAPAADEEALRRVHPAAYLAEFKRLSDGGGGELGVRAPFGAGGYEIAKLSAGLAAAAVEAVLCGDAPSAYALSRPPGHHCLPDKPMGFCLLANIAVAVEAAKATRPDLRVAVIDWDVHHGNGTEAIFYERSDVLAISLHQENNFPNLSGAVADRGAGPGEGATVNIPLPPGAGDDAYLYAMDRIVGPTLTVYRPDLIIVACGFDASGVDPLSRTMVSSDGFAAMTQRVMQSANDLCSGKLVLVHEGGYSEAHVPFCGHAVLQTLTGSATSAADPFGPRLDWQQPTERVRDFFRTWVDDIADALR